RTARLRQGAGRRLQVPAQGLVGRRSAQGPHRQGAKARHHHSDNRKHTITMAAPKDPTAKVDELAAPLDLLLTSATKPFAGRMMPNATWARFAGNLAQHPGAVADRGGALTRELGNIAVG